MSKRSFPPNRYGVVQSRPLQVGDVFLAANGLHVIYDIRGRGKHRAALLASFKYGVPLYADGAYNNDRRLVSWVKVGQVRRALESDNAERAAMDYRHFCRVCGCTDENCADCIARTGQPCSWHQPGLCSACVELCVELGLRGAVAHAEGDPITSNPIDSVESPASNDLYSAFRIGWFDSKREVNR